MKKINKILMPTVLALGAVAPVVASCAKKDSSIHVDNISFPEEYVFSLTGSESAELEVKVLPENATNKEVTYTVEDPTVAQIEEVTSNGTNKIKVKGLKQGTTNLIATSKDGGKTASNPIYVLDTPSPVSEISINYNEKVIATGESFRLSATILPLSALQYVNWEIETGSDVIKITNNKNRLTTCDVTGLKKGLATVKGTTVDGSHIVRCNIAVDQELGIKLNESCVGLSSDPQGKKTFVLKADSLPEGVMGTKITNWVSSDPSAVSVVSIDDTSATITALQNTAEGSDVTITATSSNGLTATCNVFVVSGSVPVREIKFEDEFTTAYIGKTTPGAPKHSVIPSTASTTGILWKSEDETIATVTSYGGIYGVKEGTTRITATSVATPAVSSYINVKVVKDPVYINSIELSSSKDWVLTNKTLSIHASLSPKSASKDDLVWSSSNAQIASVNSEGIVSAHKAGDVVITAKSSFNSSVFGSILIHVLDTQPQPDSMSVVDSNGKEVTSISLEQYNEMPLKVIVKQGSIEIKEDLVWKSDDTRVAIISQTAPDTATVSALTPGNINLTISCKTVPTLSKTIPVTVNPAKLIKVESIKMDKERNMSFGSFLKLDYHIVPANATYTDVKWIIDNEEIATIDQATGIIKAKKTGTVNVTAWTTEPDSEVHSWCKIKIEAKPLIEDLEMTTRCKEIDPDDDKTEKNYIQYNNTKQGYVTESNRWRKPEFSNQNQYVFKSNGRNNDLRLITRTYALNFLIEPNAPATTKSIKFWFKVVGKGFRVPIYCPAYMDTLILYKLDSAIDHPEFYTNRRTKQTPIRMDGKTLDYYYHVCEAHWDTEYYWDPIHTFDLPKGDSTYKTLKTFYISVCFVCADQHTASPNTEYEITHKIYIQ